MDILVTICARKNSKGLPNKNVKILNGKPLIEWTVEQALAWELEGKTPITIVISSDDPVIKKIALSHNLFFIDRSPELASDTVGKVS